MKQLLVMRHADAERASASMDDADRPLSPTGRRDAAAVGSWLGEQLDGPDAVIVSSAARTQQTWRLLNLEDRLTGEARIERQFYLAGPRVWLDAIHDLPETLSTVLLVGHNPGIEDLARAMAGQGSDAARARLRPGMPSGALALFLVEGVWRNLGLEHTRLVTYVAPDRMRGGLNVTS